VKFDYIPTAGLLMKAVDVLGDHRLQMTHVFKSGQPAVGHVGFGFDQNLMHTPYQQVPNSMRVAPESIDMGDLHGIDFLPQAPGAAKRRYATFSRYTGSGKGHDPPGCSYRLSCPGNQILHRHLVLNGWL
jgi:hypothetical protein